MESSRAVRLPEDWARFDRAGLIGALLFPLLLGLMWISGMGPAAFEACMAPKAPLELNLFSENGKVSLTGKVASQADKQVVIKAAAAVYGAGNVVDKIEVAGSVLPLTWASALPDLTAKLKTVDAPAALKIAGGKAVLEGVVADKATREAAGRSIQQLVGKDIALDNQLTLRPPPSEPMKAPAAPVAEPAPTPAPVSPAAPAAIAAGTLGKYRLPDGTEITILGEGFESKLVAFIADPARQIDKGVWFDFDRLYFETGSSNLTAESRAQVETLTAILKAFPNVAIKIGGYTDNVGDPDANLKLSAARAERVMKEIAGLGIAADRLEAEGYGEQHPIADNTTAEGRAKNRRTAVSVRRK